VRRPAAHAALAGLRPTVGAVSRTGMVPDNSIRDTAGPMARTVADMAVLLDVIVGLDDEDKATAESAGHIPPTYTSVLKRDALKGARLGVLRQVFTPAVTDPQIIAHFERTIAELKAAGAEIIDPFMVPEIDSIPRPPQTRARTRDDLTNWIARHPGLPFPSVKAIADSKLLHPLHQPVFDEMAAAKPVNEDPYTIKGLKDEQRYRDAFTKAMEANRIDAVISPVMAQLPAINGDRNTQLVGEPKFGAGAGSTVLGSSLTFVGSALQWPALSVADGYLGEGLPQGLQLLGRAWDDARIIGYAYAYEQATHHRRPPPTVPPLPESLLSRFIGTWRLVAIHQPDPASMEKSASGGPVSGQLMYAANGTFSLQIVRTGRKGLPASSAGSSFGRWELAPVEGCVVHHPDAGFNAARVAASEKQRYSFDAAGRLSLAAVPVSGTTNNVFVWERQP